MKRIKLTTVAFIIYNLSFIILAPKAQAQIHINDGLWRGVLTIDAQKQLELPFIFNVYYADGEPTITIFNGEERILIDEVQVKNDSLFFKMPVFDTEFKCKFFPGLMQGVWINNSRKDRSEERRVG